MQATDEVETATGRLWSDVLAELDREWLGKCLWSQMLSVEALNALQHWRTCETCVIRIGMRLADQYDVNEDARLQGQFQWGADIGGGSE